MVVALTRNLEAKLVKRGKRASLVIHRPGKWLGLSILALRLCLSNIGSNSLALQLGQLHFSSDYLRTHGGYEYQSLPDSFA